jgi:hypothetical protein
MGYCAVFHLRSADPATHAGVSAPLEHLALPCARLHQSDMRTVMETARQIAADKMA